MTRVRVFGGISCKCNAVEVKMNRNNVGSCIAETYLCKLMF
jgi:hypothetical protein